MKQTEIKHMKKIPASHFLPWQPCRENMCYHSKSYIIILFIFFVETLPAPVQLVLHIHLVPAGEKWNRDMWFVVLGNIATEANLVSSSMCLKAITSHSFLHMRPSYTVQQHGRVGQSQLFSQGLTHIPDKVTLRGLWSVPLCNVQEFCLTDMHTVHNCKNKKREHVKGTNVHAIRKMEFVNSPL